MGQRRDSRTKGDEVNRTEASTGDRLPALVDECLHLRQVSPLLLLRPSDAIPSLLPVVVALGTRSFASSESRLERSGSRFVKGRPGSLVT